MPRSLDDLKIEMMDHGMARVLRLYLAETWEKVRKAAAEVP